MAALEAYIDDSGKYNQPPVFVLAGYMARAGQWAIFSDRWRDELTKDPFINYHKAVEAHHLWGEFHGVTREKRDDKQIELVKTINQNVLCAISIAYYRDVFQGIFKSEHLDRPYYIAFYATCVLFAKLARDLGQTGKIYFIFDEQGDEPSALIQSDFDKFKAAATMDMRDFIGSRPIFRDDKQFVPLQAADMPAWHIRRNYGLAADGKDPQADRSNVYLANLLNSPHVIKTIARTEMITMRDAMRD